MARANHQYRSPQSKHLRRRQYAVGQGDRQNLVGPDPAIAPAATLDIDDIIQTRALLVPKAAEICAGARQVGAGHLKPVQFDYAAAVNAVSMLLAMLHQLLFSDRK